MKQKEALLYRMTRPIITILFRIIFTPNRSGIENIPKTGRIVLAGNHTNNLDCLLLISSTKRSIHFLAKKELWKGVKKIIFGNMGLIPVNRNSKDHEALVQAEEYLKQEQVIGIFPEGTIGKKSLLPFKMGAIKMAKDTHSLIVPFAISGTYKPFSKNLTISFGRPFFVTGDLELELIHLKEIVETLRGDDYVDL